MWPRTAVACCNGYAIVAQQLLVYNRYGLLSEFVLVFLKHMFKLMCDAERYAPMKIQWVKSDAAKASNMKKSETLR